MATVLGVIAASTVFGSTLKSGSSQGISTILIVSLQNIGGAMGNMICVHNIIAACATVGLVGMEGLLIRRNLLPMTVVGIIVGIIGLILVYTVGNGII